MLLKEECENVVIGTSSSLLFVPYSLKSEKNLSADYKKYFSFAEEKLIELNELKTIINSDDYLNVPEYIKNQSLFSQDRDAYNESVREKVKRIDDKDFIRSPELLERRKIQKERFNLPILPTTTIGSFPHTDYIKEVRSGFEKGDISEYDYTSFIKTLIRDCIKLQEEIGLDVLVHGEFERNDMVEYFGKCLNGYVFTEEAWVQSYGTRCVKPPIIWGDVSREKPMTVKWSVYAQSLTDKPIKGMLTGPVTILNWSFPREDVPLSESVFQIALAIREEALELEANGIKIIQIDEAALREKLPLRKSDWYDDYLDWAIPAFRLVHSGVCPETQIHTHMCYSEFGDIIPAIESMDADVIAFEASRSDLAILSDLKENTFKTQVGPGVYDIHSPRVPSEEEILSEISEITKHLDINQIWINPDCGLKTRQVTEVAPSLTNMVSAAKSFRKKIN